MTIPLTTEAQIVKQALISDDFVRKAIALSTGLSRQEANQAINEIIGLATTGARFDEWSKRRLFGSIGGPAPDPATWACKIGEIDRAKLASGSDLPMRLAIEDAYYRLTGESCTFVFSGWGAELDEPERAIVDQQEQ
jgi:hypothetical protein